MKRAIDRAPVKTPMERMVDLTRRIVAVSKSELPRPKKRKRKRAT
jgi:hypothetical protein